jgi:hypothetical protein
MARQWLCALAALVLCADASADAPAAPPAIDLVLKPHQADGKVDYVDVTMTVAAPNLAAGATFVHMPLVVASIPTQRYDGDAIQARDATGALPLTIKDEPATPFLSYRDWAVGRATSGDVTLTYRAIPRKVDASTRNGPLFDVREEAGGVYGAGFTFLAPPVAPGPHTLHLHWDLSAMPAGSRGIWSFGEGDVTKVTEAEQLATTFFFAGPVKSYPANGSDTFAMYWLSEPPFDATGAATMIKKLFDYVAVFFHDKGEPYRVFIRRSPAGGGGTALTRSFFFGYGMNKVPTVKDLEGLIAHEMVHNWPTLDGDHADTSWYTEGNAEYYSILLSYRAGLTTPDEFLKQINERADGYYTNPLQTLSNHDAEKIYWKDARAGHVPYGRGWMYLARVDAHIRAASHGKRSLDDIVLAFADRTQKGESVTPADWEKAITAELGAKGAAEYHDMLAGKWLNPPANAFGPCFHPKAVTEFPQELGFDPIAFVADHRIKNLEAGSAAAKAGLKEGDEVVDPTDVGNPSFSYTDPMPVKVRRNGAEQTITFVPRGKTVTGYRWVRNKHVSDAACKV